MTGLFSEAVPEFLGSLSATLLVSFGARTMRKARSRAAARNRQTTSGDE
ncbi:hypothetical protein [Streptomyces sp. NPDC054854]